MLFSCAAVRPSSSKLVHIEKGMTPKEVIETLGHDPSSGGFTRSGTKYLLYNVTHWGKGFVPTYFYFQNGKLSHMSEDWEDLERQTAAYNQLGGISKSIDKYSGSGNSQNGEKYECTHERDFNGQVTKTNCNKKK